MTTAEAADRLGVKPRSVVWAIKQGHITATKRGRDYWIEEDEVERYRQERRPAHRPATTPRTAGATSDKERTE